jgi:hypothetical protein
LKSQTWFIWPPGFVSREAQADLAMIMPCSIRLDDRVRYLVGLPSKLIRPIQRIAIMLAGFLAVR